MDSDRSPALAARGRQGAIPWGGVRVTAEGRSWLVFAVPLDVESADDPLVVLTAAQTEVVRLVLEGLSSKAIAAIRGCSISTVTKLLEQSYRRLGISGRAELAALVASTRSR